MASLNKKDYAKRDMNFFSEFTASSQAFARAAGWVVIFSIAVIAVTVLICIAKAVNYGVINNSVNEYDKKFNTDEYRNLKIQAEELATKASNINKYNYVMQSMKTSVESETGVEFDIISNIEEHIPSNLILKGYDIDKGTITITGEAHSYYAPTEMINMIKETLVVTNEDMSIERVDPSTLGGSEQFVYNYINASYKFEYTATLVTNCAVKISYIGPDNMILKDLETQWVETGDVLTLNEIATISYAGQNYNLESISVNGQSISPDAFVAASQKTDANPNGLYRAYISGDAKIDLYYAAEVIATAGGDN